MIPILVLAVAVLGLVAPAPETQTARPASASTVQTPTTAAAKGYSESRDTGDAQALADWAATHDIGTVGNSDIDLGDLRRAVSDYPGDPEVAKLVRTAHKQRVAADDAYGDEKVAKGDAKRKAALATMTKARRAMTADFNAALTKAGPATAYRTDSSGARLEVASLASTATLVRWVDGDTAVTSAGRVRLVGVDTPEVSDTCSKANEATANAVRLAPPGTALTLRNPASVQDTDKYGRLLRYVEVDGQDVGYSQIRNGLGTARYDGRDGYDTHPRQGAYRADSQDHPTEDPLCDAGAAAAAALLLSADDTDHHLWVLTPGQKGTTRLLLDDDWDRARSLTKTELSDARHDARVRIKKAAEAKAKAEAEAARKAKAAAEAAAKKAAAEAAEAAREATSSGSDSGSSSSPVDPYPGYTGPRCYAPGGKTWKPC